MTMNQLIAMSFPLVTAAAVALVALFVRRPWAEKLAEAPSQIPAIKGETLEQLERLNAQIEGNAHLARQQLRR